MISDSETETIFFGSWAFWHGYKIEKNCDNESNNIKQQQQQRQHNKKIRWSRYIVIDTKNCLLMWKKSTWYKCSFIFLCVSSYNLSAPVSRIVKYFRRDGTPLITVGGYTYDFVQNKTTCEDEHHMLIRVGLLSFQTIADFTVDIMKKWVNNRPI